VLPSKAARIIRQPVAEEQSNPRQSCTLETISSAEGFESLAGEWDDLVRAMARPSPFLLHGWLVEWWRYFGDGARLAVATARREGHLVGAAPMYVRRSYGVRVARFLGGHESALADLLLASGEPRSTGSRLLEEVRRQPFDYADLFGVPGHSRLADSGGPPLRLRVEAPVLDMPDGWEAAYAAKTSSKKRNLHRRRLRQLSEVGEVDFVVGRTRAELEPLLEDAFHLHGLRWEGRPDGSTFGTEVGQRFHRAAATRLADDDVLRIVLMRVGGRPAAFHYFFALDGVMIVHRLGFDPGLSRYSPGLVATLETLRIASEDNLTRVEFLGGGERYKVELADRLEPLSQAIGLARNPLGTVAARQRLALIQLRKTLKRSERLHRLYLNGRRQRRPRDEQNSADGDGAG
jgi:CelD/BcsL family acetyltransferase involved in cellulose biosynthesis